MRDISVAWLAGYRTCERTKSHTVTLGLVDALSDLLECCSCQNGCAPNDMTCATNKARAELRKARAALRKTGAKWVK